MTFDFNFSNDKPSLRELIPGDVPLLLEMTYTPGGADIPGTPQAQKQGALTQSKSTDALYLKAEFTVLRGPFKGRKFWSNMTMWGGKVDEKGQSKGGNISRESIRSLLDSSQGLSSKDETPEAAAKRVLPLGFKSLQRRRFVAFSKVEKGKDGYADKNTLGQILTIDMPKYPKSDADFDAPAKAAAPAVAAAPAWVAPAQTAQPSQSATQTENLAATALQTAQVALQIADNTPSFAGGAGSFGGAGATGDFTPPATVDNGLPAWAA